MGTKEITILGYSDAYITMLFDLLVGENYNITILDNQSLYDEIRIKNNTINYSITNELKDSEFYLYGSAKTSTRSKLIDVFKIDNNKLTSIISDKSFVSNTVKIGLGVIINPMCSIAGQTIISDNVFINRSVSIGHHTIIGENTSINPGSNIAGNVIIGKNCQIGIGSTILDNIMIGDNVIIGAGSVVTKNIPSNVIAYGIPCKIIKTNE